MLPGLATSTSVSDCSHRKRVTIGHFAPRLPPIAASRQSNHPSGKTVSDGQSDPAADRWRLGAKAFCRFAPCARVAARSLRVKTGWYTRIPSVNQEHAAGERLAASPRQAVQKSVIRRLAKGHDRPAQHIFTMAWGAGLASNGDSSGADERTRTFTPVKEQRPQRCASTNSATSAHSVPHGQCP